MNITDDQRLPTHYMQVWIEGNKLKVRVPDSHTLTFPTDRINSHKINAGIEAFLDLLRTRARMEGPIGSESDPVQYDLDKIISDWMAVDGNKIKRPEPKATDAERQAKRDMTAARKAMASVSPEELEELLASSE